MVPCFIGLGSNLEQPRQQLVRAFSELALLTSSKLITKSSLYISKPLGPQDQPDYINAVAELETSLPALTLLSSMQAIESEHQRVRTEHWGPRTLDLDLLLYGQETISVEQLKVPHPEMVRRNFVLYPLFEIAPDLNIPGLGSLKNLLTKLDDSDLQKLEPDE
ncbi:MAG: 2-amino-4-hydroxy-6-hydroxymethyldihydropteridine diphosphokinase [Gammaproteobacteria bacterium]|jgi:2-amino-4-hydroxy-6-hydroxymethyldihydropteridine diphosphokinase|nr:2-amino-4-hydroxy-6-hydroxymethyldihydropteridine diphosphokinase [Gammaproteobacteria bacterium]